MGFTTQIFTFAFLPLSMLFYYATYFIQRRVRFLQKIRLSELCVILFSLLFYAWACFDDVFRLCGYILALYVMGIIIQYFRDRNISVKLTDKSENKDFGLALIITLIFCAIIITLLIYFKYSNITTSLINFMLKQNNVAKSVMAPLGVSFITFSAISYIVDIYKNKADAGNIIDCALYISFFAKVVSGPIVLWRDFKAQHPQVSLSSVSDGAIRVMFGFAKKLILADSFGLYISKMSYAIDVPTAWGMAFLYMLQIYYDFSGYSDIALGLSKMIGYSFEENFNFPYLSTSITEFWRRWHISLGRWFREYVYFPLGGSRKGKTKAVINIGIVFILTGIWHGAGWTYMLWGIANGICNIAEKLLAENKVYLKTPKFVKWFMTMGVTFFCWQLFRAPDIRTAGRWILSMFGLINYDGITHTAQYYFDLQTVVFMIVGAFCATVLGLPAVRNIYKKALSTKTGYIVNLLIAVILFVIAIFFMVNSTYSPFLYFQY